MIIAQKAIEFHWHGNGGWHASKPIPMAGMGLLISMDHYPPIELFAPSHFLAGYWQPGNLKEAIRVLQLKEPLAFKYSLVYQKVQSSTGSTVMAL